jgi:hypothetical protein
MPDNRRCPFAEPGGFAISPEGQARALIIANLRPACKRRRIPPFPPLPLLFCPQKGMFSPFPPGFPQQKGGFPPFFKLEVENPVENVDNLIFA